jgi:hypothetical protein
MILPTRKDKELKPMKRSEINAIMREADAFMKAFG